MARILIYVVPNKLKLLARRLALVLVGDYSRETLAEVGFSVFVKRGRLVLCSSCACYAVSKLINSIKGVLHGHIRWLRLNGIGYRALITLNKLELSLGLSYKPVFELPSNVDVKVFKNNKLKLKSANLDAVSTMASALKLKRRPDVYRAKGIILRKLRVVKDHG